MVYHVGQDLASVLVVFAKLGASVVVGEGDDGVDRPFDSAQGPVGELSQMVVEAPDNLLADTVNATDRGNDPDLVSNPDTSIAAAEPAEGPADLRGSDLHLGGIVRIIQQTFQVGFDAVMVNPFPGLNGLEHMSDGEAVLDDILPFGKRLKCYLVPLGDICLEGYTLHQRPRFQVGQGDGHVVRRIYPYVIH